MDTMERYKIRKSIEDVIAILDSAPMNQDLIPETNIVQLTNRAPIAHLAIERGLKALIINAGKSADQKHSLDRLYRALTECDEEAANFLAKPESTDGRREDTGGGVRKLQTRRFWLEFG